MMAASQTYAVNVCSEVFPGLDKNHPQVAELYEPDAEQEFQTRLELFKSGADLREL